MYLIQNNKGEIEGENKRSIKTVHFSVHIGNLYTELLV